jgi:hypothetical protein
MAKNLSTVMKHQDHQHRMDNLKALLVTCPGKT